jgi:hypothetical protein
MEIQRLIGKSKPGTRLFTIRDYAAGVPTVLIGVQTG